MDDDLDPLTSDFVWRLTLSSEAEGLCPAIPLVCPAHGADYSTAFRALRSRTVLQAMPLQASSDSLLNSRFTDKCSLRLRPSYTKLCTTSTRRSEKVWRRGSCWSQARVIW